PQHPDASRRQGADHGRGSAYREQHRQAANATRQELGHECHNLQVAMGRREDAGYFHDPNDRLAMSQEAMALNPDATIKTVDTGARTSTEAAMAHVGIPVNWLGTEMAQVGKLWAFVSRFEWTLPIGGLRMKIDLEAAIRELEQEGESLNLLR